MISRPRRPEPFESGRDCPQYAAALEHELGNNQNPPQETRLNNVRNAAVYDHTGVEDLRYLIPREVPSHQPGPTGDAYFLTFNIPKPFNVAKNA